MPPSGQECPDTLQQIFSLRFSVFADFLKQTHKCYHFSFYKCQEKQEQ